MFALGVNHWLGWERPPFPSLTQFLESVTRGCTVEAAALRATRLLGTVIPIHSVTVADVCVILRVLCNARRGCEGYDIIDTGHLIS
jgi:hypothetical protein